MQLYWVTTEDHLEDWFVVARTEREAEIFFEREEGYDDDDAWATEVRGIPESMRCEKGWPSTELLIALGGKFHTSPDDDTRVVEFGGEIYGEGMLESLIRECCDDQLEKTGAGRPNHTVKKNRIVS